MASEKVTPSPEAERPGTERIAKVMARSGICSRRDAEKMILAGRVTVNGKAIDSPALDVSARDKITLDGKPIDAPQETRVWLYYKPLGLVTSEKDEKGRQTVFDTLPEGMPRVMSVGRLDLNSEGLLLLTNDGGLKRRLELPETGWLRKYRVRVNGRPDNATFDPLRRGIILDGEEFQPMEITLDRQQGANAWLTVGIREGRNREIRRAMEEVKMVVNRLIRVSYGPFRLNEMEPGAVVEVKRKILRDQLGERLLTGNEDAPERAPRHSESDRGSERGAGARRPRDDSGRGEGGRGEGGRFNAGDRKPYGAKPRDEGDRKPYGDRPRREDGGRGEGPRKPYGARPDDRPQRDEGSHKPFGPRGDAPADGSRKPRWSADKPAGKAPGGGSQGRSYGDKPSGRGYGDKPGGKPYADRAEGRSGADRSGPKASGYKTHAARSDDRPGGKPSGDRPRSFGDKPAGKPSGDRPRSFGDKPAGKPSGDRPRSFGDKPAGKPYGDKPRSFGDKPAGKPYGDKPGGKSAGFKSHGGGAGGGRSTGFKSHGGAGRPASGAPRGAGGGKSGPRGRG